MNSTREQVWVGSFVLVAVGLVLAVVLSVSGAFRTTGVPYRAYFKFSGGLVRATPVRYGGLLAGQVEAVGVDPRDVSRIQIEFRVDPGIPVKTDTVAKISSLGALGETYLELSPGTNSAREAIAGSVIPSQETFAIADLGTLMAHLTPIAEQTLETLNARLGEMQLTIASANELLSERNRRRIERSLTGLNDILTDTRPKISATLSNLQVATERFPAASRNLLAASEALNPLIGNLNASAKLAQEALAHIDGVILENRGDLRASVLEARRTLESANRTIDALRTTLDRNSENLDDTLVNVRSTSGNLKEMTDTLKRRPSLLIRGELGKDRQPGATR